MTTKFKATTKVIRRCDCNWRDIIDKESTSHTNLCYLVTECAHQLAASGRTGTGCVRKGCDYAGIVSNGQVPLLI